ncbi:MAG: 2-succinyl-6-hydroxy-2,4-cyclohexadiene-1-carboxylate synthase [Candidatus Hydrogenedentes bacterium]|nr:2-succinyl-6-hydroxy-2,4-cyclohexadiene-1-carboxylate synthase [Candidatus Hydrogenedentota bacterium]
MSSADAIQYTFRGESNQPVIVFLHGFMGRGSDWDAMAAELAPSHASLLVDLPGHGRTRIGPGARVPDFETTCAALDRLVAGLEMARHAVVGYSMGGRLALYWALRHPGGIERLVLESASPGLRGEGERAARRAEDERRAIELETGDFEAFLRRWYAMPLFASLARDPERLEGVIARRLENDPAQLAASLRAAGTGRQPSLWNELGGLSMPALLLAGEEDAKFQGIASAMAAACPAARAEVVAGCGHNIHLEQPGAFAQRLRAFLAPAE